MFYSKSKCKRESDRCVVLTPILISQVIHFKAHMYLPKAETLKIEEHMQSFMFSEAFCCFPQLKFSCGEAALFLERKE